MSVDPIEWEELQRDCHPFPAYIDYLHGQPTPFDLAVQQVRSRMVAPPQQGFIQYHGYNTRSSALHMPVPNSSSRQFQQKQEGRPLATASRQSFPQSNPLPPEAGDTQLPSEGPVHILRRNEILQPRYSWMSEQNRHMINDKLNMAYDFLGQNDRPDLIHQASATLHAISKRVGEMYTVYLQAETTKRNVQAAIPEIWRVYKARDALPPMHPHKDALTKHLRLLLGRFSEPGKMYARGLVTQLLDQERLSYGSSSPQKAYEASPSQISPSLKREYEGIPIGGDEPWIRDGGSGVAAGRYAGKEEAARLGGFVPALYSAV
ncbi:hypothetical protein CC80DRAFT_531297 [Byssothecium circinans]|uniref:Uncharacterized protein n=1 Tax=Byssothecium circinans TaxID=147558 RepID=A0A6A5UDL1_9PLEO|nr:hypothetical protein CC80DRAFT_531297 [Byssothecium circinans]